jgi:hypothetical protein
MVMMIAFQACAHIVPLHHICSHVFFDNFKAIDELARIISKKKLSYSKDRCNV